MKGLIAVLGGSHLQYNFINTALSEGHKLIVLDGNPNCLASRDKRVKFYPIDFSNLKEVKRIARENEIELIYSPSTEVGNLVSARLAKEFPYKYNEVKTVQKTLDKIKQRALKDKLSLFRMPNWKTITDSETEFCDHFQFPIILKVNNSSGGRGVIKLGRKKDFKSSLDSIKNFRNIDSRILIEEFVQGDQFSIETISYNREHYIYAITKEIIGGAPNFIERSHFMSPKIYDIYKSKFNAGVVELLNVLKIEYGSCHIEVIVDGKGDIYLVEIASRTGGWRDYLAEYAGHTNINKLLIDVHLNDQLNTDLLTPPNNESLVNILIYPDDLHTVRKGKRDSVLQSWYINDKEPNKKPKSLLDAYGYAYFNSNSSLERYSLS